MPDPILRGTTDPQRQKRVWTQNLQSGGSYSEHYKGLSLAKMQTVQNSVLWTARNSSLTESAGICELTIEWGADGGGGGGGGSTSSKSITIDRWECPEPKESKDLLTHPKFVAAIAALNVGIGEIITERHIHDITAIIRGQATAAQSSVAQSSAQDRMEDAVDAYTVDEFTSLVTLPQIVLDFFRLYANSQTHYQSAQYAIRHTTTAPGYWSANVADFNVNCVLNHGQAAAEMSDPTAWNYPLPGRLAYKLAAATAGFDATTPARAGYQIGWLKSPSSEASVGRGRIEIQTTYVLDQWSTAIYPLASF